MQNSIESRMCPIYFEVKGQRSMSQCMNYWKWFPAHNYSLFTPIIMKLHTQTPHESRMCLEKLSPRGVFVPLGQPRSSYQLTLCFSDWSEDQDGSPGLWLTETFFDFSATVERNLMKLDRKHDLNIFYQVCVFGAILKAKMAHPQPSLWFSGWSLSEQVKLFDIEHQPPFGDHYTLPQMRGGGATKQTGTSYTFDKVWSSAPEGCVGKLFSVCFIHNVCTQAHQCGLLFSCNFVEHLQQTCSLLCEGEFPLEYVSQTCGLVADSLQLAFKRPWCCKTQERCLWGTASHIPIIFSWALDCL